MFSQSKFWTRIRQTRELVANRIQEQLRNDRRKNIRRSLSMPTATEILEDRTLLASFTVDTLVDENDGIGTGGVSLRDAIAAASDGDDITFSVQGTINLTNGELTIDKGLSIDGETNQIIIDAGGSNRVFNVDDGNTNNQAVVSLANLTIANGDGSTGFGRGGGIHNLETLTISNATIANNMAFNGGGIANDGTLTIFNSTITGNSVGNSGGGIANSDGAILTVINTTISGNSANQGGGGILNIFAPSPNGPGVLTVSNSTITGNTADADDSGFSFDAGGGIAGDGTETLNNSIVAGNFRGTTAPVPDDIDNTIETANHNLIGDSGTAGNIIDGQDGNIVGNSGTGTLAISTVLDTTLADNGGATETHALITGSPAIDAGSDPLAVDGMNNALMTDQRGTGFARIQGAMVDIGAFETLGPPSTLIVNTLVDENDGIATGSVSLRDAIAAIADGGTITFGVQGTINLTNGELMIDKGVSIDGEMNNIVIDAQSNSRVLQVNDGNPSNQATVNLANLTIQNGLVALVNGAGIWNFEDLTISDSAITGNTGADDGGGINNQLGTLTVMRSVITGNSANTGGGIGNTGELSVIDSAISGNMATSVGGGISTNASAFVLNSTIDNNTSGGRGGGISNRGIFQVINSTVSGNSANGNGGGIFTNSDTLTVTNSTITGNIADADNNDPNEVGGGIFAGDDVGTVEILNNSIIAGNFVDGTTTANDIDGDTINTANNNLIGDANTAGGIMNGQDGNIVGNNGSGTIDITTVLDTNLANNGGPTQTHALVTGSPAINAGDNALTVDAMSNPLTTDQRGTGNPRISGSSVDMGAFEAVANAMAVINSPVGTTETGNITINFDVIDSLNSPVELTFGWSIDNGVTYTDATPAMSSPLLNPASNLATPISGGTFVWNSFADIVGTENILFRVSVNNGTNFREATTMITVDNPPAELSIDDVTMAEGNSGDTAVTFTVSLNQITNQDVQFNFTAVDGTAQQDANGGDDFLNAANTATIPRGQTQTTITIFVKGDTKVEADETFTVMLSNAMGAIIADDTGVGTISNDDVATISIDDVTAAEGNAGSTVFTFTVTLDAEVDTGVSFDFETGNNTATASDFTALTTTTRNFGSVTAGSTETITVQVNGDTQIESDETFFLNLSAISAGGRQVTFSDSQGLGTITNDDAATLSITDVNVIERNNGTSQAIFTVTLDNTVDTPFTVDFATNDGTATAGSDYTAVNGTLNFVGSAGETQTVSVDINGDHDFEVDEQFSVDLSNLQAGGRNVTITVGTGDGLIQNDDLRPNQATFVTNPVPSVDINGNFTTLVSGNFDDTPTVGIDDIFFWNPNTGANLLLFGDATRTQQANAIDPTLINGGDFTEVLVGNFDGGGNTDLLFWNPISGRNRLIHLNGSTGSVMNTFQTNVIDPTQINGNDFTTAVVGNFDGIDQADVFFWNPTSGRNRIAHFVAVTAGTDSAVSNIQDNVIDPTQINGNDFESVHVGEFESGGVDELLFTNLASGENRRVSFMPSGGSTAVDMIRDGNASLLNGSVYKTVEVADLNGDGLDDVFAWNPTTGENRSVLSDIDPTADPAFVDNALAAGGVNGDYEQTVRLIEDVFTNTPQDDLFFWNPTTGANRIGSL